MKPILGALLLVPLMEAFALAQEPNADAKEGRLYLEGGLGFGVASMALDAEDSDGFDSHGLFGLGFAAQYGLSDQLSFFTKLGVGIVMHDDPGVTSIGMMFDGAYKLIEKKGDVPALSAYAGLGFVNIEVDPDGGSSEDETDFVLEFGIQADIGTSDSWSLQPFSQIQLVMGSRPFSGYNSVLQVTTGVKLLLKLSDQVWLTPSLAFTGGNFQDNVIFGIGVQVRL